MRKIGTEPLKQVERNKRYREAHKLAFFSVAIEQDLYDGLRNKLSTEGMTRKEFLVDAIKRYLSRGD